MIQNEEHQKLVDEILFAVGSQKNIRLWIRSVGVARALKSDNIISFGVKGEADLQGIIAPEGKFLGIEVKTGNARQNPSQKNWQRMIEKFGGVYILARSVEQVLSELEEYL